MKKLTKSAATELLATEAIKRKIGGHYGSGGKFSGLWFEGHKGFCRNPLTDANHALMVLEAWLKKGDDLRMSEVDSMSEHAHDCTLAEIRGGYWEFVSEGSHKDLSHAICTAVRALTNKGDAVIIAQPVYYPFSEAVLGNHRKLVVNQLVYSEGKYSIDFEEIGRAHV